VKKRKRRGALNDLLAGGPRSEITPLEHTRFRLLVELQTITRRRRATIQVTILHTKKMKNATMC